MFQSLHLSFVIQSIYFRNIVIDKFHSFVCWSSWKIGNTSSRCNQNTAITSFRFQKRIRKKRTQREKNRANTWISFVTRKWNSCRRTKIPKDSKGFNEQLKQNESFTHAGKKITFPFEQKASQCTKHQKNESRDNDFIYYYAHKSEQLELKRNKTILKYSTMGKMHSGANTPCDVVMSWNAVNSRKKIVSRAFVAKQKRWWAAHWRWNAGEAFEWSDLIEFQCKSCINACESQNANEYVNLCIRRLSTIISCFLCWFAS